MEKATASLNYDEHHSAHRLPRWQKMPLCQLSVRAGSPESIRAAHQSSHARSRAGFLTIYI